MGRGKVYVNLIINVLLELQVSEDHTQENKSFLEKQGV